MGPTEDGVLPVEPGAGHGGDEELRPVRVRPRVRHAQQTRSRVPVREVLVRKLFFLFVFSFNFVFCLCFLLQSAFFFFARINLIYS